LVCICVGLLAWYISFVTGKPYKKPKNKAAGKGGKKGFLKFGKK